MNDILKRAQALPPPHWGVVPVPLELLPTYYALWKIEPIPGFWHWDRDQFDHVLLLKKTSTPEQSNTQG